MEDDKTRWGSVFTGDQWIEKLHAGHLGRLTYGQVIGWNVNRKWPTPEGKEIWYSRFTLSRRRKLIKLFKRQEGICHFCDIQCWMPESDKEGRLPSGSDIRSKHRATVDHKIPQAHGGTDRMTNLVMACSDCNNRRQTMPYEEFLRIRRDPVEWKKHTTKLARQLTQRKQDRALKSVERRNTLIWNIALLFYLHSTYESRL